MLTQEQLEQLQPLTNHPKYGKILSDAIEIWKTEINPIYGKFGIIYNENTECFIPNSRPSKGCCLMGASIVNFKSKTGDIAQALVDKYNISMIEFYSIYYGFDNIKTDHKLNKEACDFGKKVREIIKPLYGWDLN